MMRIALLLTPLLCGPGHAADDKSSPVELMDRMQTHFRHATAARKAVISGDLAAVKAAAGKLAELEPIEGLPDSAKPTLVEMTGIAKRLHEAPDLAQAGKAVAELGASCAACHTLIERGPASKLADLPEQVWSEAAHMNRHAWAADWMWLGLVSPSSSAWDKGLQTLSAEPTWANYADLPTMTDGEILEQQVHLLVDKASEAKTPEDRVELYGWFLTACAECHTRVRKKDPK